MQKWNISKCGRSDNSETLRARIAYIFYELGGSDEDIQEMLEKDGFAIMIRGVMDIRKSAGMYRRTIDPAENSRKTVKLLTVILQGDHPIDNKGKTLLMEVIRKKRLMIARSESHVIDFHQKILTIYRNRLFAAYRSLNPKAVRKRLHNLQRRKKEYIVPGSNYIWSIDDHCKLDPYKIEIYAAIDAYFRYVI
jgi:hypothetical protein